MKLIKKFILLAIISVCIGKSYGDKDTTPAPQATVTPSPTPVIVEIVEEEIFSTETGKFVESISVGPAIVEPEKPVVLPTPTPAEKKQPVTVIIQAEPVKTPAPTQAPTTDSSISVPPIDDAAMAAPTPEPEKEQIPLPTPDADKSATDLLSPQQTALPQPEPTPTPAPFDIGYWVTFAQSYAQGIGLVLSDSATDCWDNPIPAGPHCLNIEKDITGRLNRYKNLEGFTDVWIWTEQTSDGNYSLYIGYA